MDGGSKGTAVIATADDSYRRVTFSNVSLRFFFVTELRVWVFSSCLLPIGLIRLIREVILSL